MRSTNRAKTRVQEAVLHADPARVKDYIWLAKQQPRDEDRYQLRLRMVDQGMTAYQAANDWFGAGLSSRKSFDGLYYLARQVEDDIIEFFDSPSVVHLAHQVCGYDEVVLGMKDLPDVRRIIEICHDEGVETEVAITIRRMVVKEKAPDGVIP